MIFAVAMVKDEADILEPWVRHLFAEGVDHLLIADNLSTDGTRDLLDHLAGGYPITVQDDNEIAYEQSRKMTALAHQAGAMGATWILPVDADEVFYSPLGRLVDVLAAEPYDVHFAATFEHVPMEWDDPSESNPLRRIQHRRPDPKPMMKCLAKYHPTMRIWQGNHQIDHPNFPESLGRGVVEIREFQYRTLEQAARKVRNGRIAYEATDMPEYEGSHWREMGAWDDAQLEAWWKGYRAQDVVLDPAPVA